MLLGHETELVVVLESVVAGGTEFGGRFLYLAVVLEVLAELIGAGSIDSLGS